ncbi:uncharacterized protein LOC122066790 isoform X2 [Macadamia integrifolia]|uniref:uncharacterized protein LOC122066790 isoform X2 n=1 Tax=Macadamia integrifolia TaxID=60698 RepID=UPI001C4EAB9B|nr:uncharacterized protein LOC122066790 isoform X2 [Macadamia integrifolia]
MKSKYGQRLTDHSGCVKNKKNRERESICRNEAMFLEEAKKRLEEHMQKRSTEDIECLTHSSLQIVKDRTGNCHVGAIASTIDAVGATAVAIYTGDLKVSINFNISYFSTVKIQEEVAIEAKMVAHRGKLSLTIVEFRRKKDGVMVALGSQALCCRSISSKPPLKFACQRGFSMAIVNEKGISISSNKCCKKPGRLMDLKYFGN